MLTGSLKLTTIEVPSRSLLCLGHFWSQHHSMRPNRILTFHFNCIYLYAPTFAIIQDLNKDSVRLTELRAKHLRPRRNYIQTKRSYFIFLVLPPRLGTRGTKSPPPRSFILKQCRNQTNCIYVLGTPRGHKFDHV